MRKPTYTEIPDTSDTNYWEIGKFNNKDRTQRFFPKDKELHQQLKTKAWEAVQARQNRKQRDLSLQKAPGGLPKST